MIKQRIGEHLDDINVTFIGHSLGGFWAYYFAYKFPTSKAILINPFLNPQEYVTHAGTFYCRYYGRITVTSEELLNYNKYNVLGTHDKKVTAMLLVDRGDTSINHEQTIALLDKKNTDIFSFKGGSHRFSHLKQAMPIIEWFYNKE